MYTHASTKDELIESVVDEAYGEIEAPAAAGSADWREAAGRCPRTGCGSS
ncbi:hypothetical protein [Streptomyces mobaraensis]|nr:hypothetical protein [Streptomyces mobaraensis]